MFFVIFVLVGRPAGSKDSLHEAKRRELILKMRERLGRFGAVRASWRELAAAAGVSLSTLTHYFGKRESIVVAVFEDDLLLGEKPLSRLAKPQSTFAASVDHAIHHIAFGLTRGGLGDSCVIGLREGLRDPAVGPAFLRFTVHPIVVALSAKFRSHQSTGEMRPCDLQIASMLLLSPVLFACLHEVELGGADEFPLPLSEFWKEHADGFRVLYGTAPGRDFDAL